MSPRAILFDLDGTLVNSEAENGDAAVAAVAALGQPLGPADQALLRTFVIGRTWADAAGYAVEREWVCADAEALARTMLELKLAKCRVHGMPVLPHAAEAVRQAQRRAQVAIVSGSQRSEITVALGALGLDGIALVGAEDYRRGKPAPDPYLTGAERLRIDPAACVAVEDSQAGITSAHAAGMRVIAVSAGNFAGQDQSQADRLIGTLAELDRVLDEPAFA